MQKTRIEWCDYVWNTILGCMGGCFYCYAKDFHTRFHRNKSFWDIEYLESEFEKGAEKIRKLKKPSSIFVCSTSDLFGNWVRSEWIQKHIDIAKENKKHIFLFLTKNPKRYAEFNFPANCWLGATITDGEANFDIKNGNKKFLSIEPMLSSVKVNCRVDLIIVGAMTGRYARQYRAKKEWVDNIIAQAKKYNIPYFLKNNLGGVI